MRLAHAENNDAETCKRFADGEIAADAYVTTDGHAGYNGQSLGERPHDAIVQTKSECRADDAVQTCHWTVSLLKRWLIGTHASAVRPKHSAGLSRRVRFPPQPAQDHGVARIAARVIERLVAKPPITMRRLVDTTKSHRRFASTQAAQA